MKVAVAMSGGVDSTFAALRLVEEGFTVTGVTLRLLPCAEFAELKDEIRPMCCRPEDLADARRIARALGIHHYVLDVSSEFEATTIGPSIDAYIKGLTPNPCVICNEKVKFGILLREIKKSGFDKLATGHYARVKQSDGRHRLLKGVDRERDQSYFLYRLNQEMLSQAVFPAGGYTKCEVREMVRSAGLLVCEKPESRDICFVRNGTMRDFVRAMSPGDFQPGPVKDLEGNIIGEHEGAAGYTIGQRKGLGVAGGTPLYVVRIDIPSNTVVLGPEEALYSSEVRLRQIVCASGLTPSEEKDYEVKIRYRAEPVPARLHEAGNGVWVARTHRPVRAVSPGQSAVFYEGEEVVFGGLITG